MLEIFIYTYLIGSLLSSLIVLSELNTMRKENSLGQFLFILETKTKLSRRVVINMLFVTAILFSWIGVIASIDLKLKK